MLRLAICCLLVVPVVAQSRPDFTGVWAIYRGAPAPPAASALVLKPEYAKPYDEQRAVQAEAAKRGEQLANASVQCVPYGVPNMMSVAVYPVEFIQSPKQLTIISEAFSEVRRVYLDRRQAPIDDVAPGYYGRSVGRWDGDALLIDTIGIKPPVAGYRGMPHSEKMHITERLKLVAPDILHDQITIEDPVVLEKPVTYTVGYKRSPNYEMVEFVCDNNREYVDEKGVVRMRVHDR